MADPQILLGWWNHLFTPVWAAALWRATWQGGLALLLVWIVCRAWPAVPPRLRVWLWRLAYLKLLLAWVWAGALTLNILPAMPHRPAPKPAAQPALSANTAPQPAPGAPPVMVKTVAKSPIKTAPTVTPQPAVLPVSIHPTARWWHWTDLLPLLGACWLLGIGLGVLRLLISMRLVHRLRHEGHPVSDETLLRLRVQMVKLMGLRKAPMLLAHPTEGPLLLGMVHPVIIVPEAMLAGSEEELQLALAHELAHVRRRDILWGWLPVLVELLFFFHPLVYLARREYRLAQEIATDAHALHRTGAAPKTYGAMLVNGAAVQAGYRPVPVAVGIMESYLVLHRRLTAMKHLSISPRQRVLAGLLVGLLALFALVPWRLSAAEYTPDTPPPPPKQPVPNARDIYLKAHEELLSHSINGSNGYKYDCFDIYDMAEGDIKPGEGTVPRGKPTPTLEMMQEIMRADQPAMDLLHQGFTAEYCEVPCRAYNTQFPHFVKFRALTRACVADAYTRSFSDDWAGAMTSCLDGMRLGAEVPHGGVTISMLVGVALQDIARMQAWKIVPHLSAQDAGAAAHRLESIMARRVPVADIMQEEKWLLQAVLQGMLQKPNWQTLMSKDFLLDEKETARLKILTPSAILADADRSLDAMIDQAKLPYARRDIQKPASPRDPLCRAIPELTEKALIRDTTSMAQNALLLAALALQAYHAEHGNYPDTLAALAPTCIKAVPDDPFALQAPLHYQRTETGYLLYSIGPDGKDNGGTPCGYGPNPEDKYIKVNSTGDIVAGVNLR